MSKIILVDFDGTVVEAAFPQIGAPIPGAFDVLKELKAAGHRLILWTCREDEGHKIDKQYLTEAVNFCKANGVEFDAVNEALADDFRPECVRRRKPYFDFAIDDRNLGGFVSWDVIRQAILQGKTLQWMVVNI